jgi:hypothetical protein
MKIAMNQKAIPVFAAVLILGTSAVAVLRCTVNRENVSVQIDRSEFRENGYSGDIEAHLSLGISNSSSETLAFRICAIEINGHSGWRVDEAHAAAFRARRFIRVEPRTAMTTDAVVPMVRCPWRVRLEVYRMPGRLRRLAWVGSRLLQGSSRLEIRENWPYAGIWILADARPLFECVSDSTTGFAGQVDSQEPPVAAPIRMSLERSRSNGLHAAPAVPGGR